MRRSNFCVLALAVVLLATNILVVRGETDSPGRMAPEQLRAAGYKPLAPNDSLDQWELKPWHKGHWAIKDGIINYDGKASNKSFQKNSLWTKQDYGDFTMYAEWRLPSTPTMKPHPIVLYNGDFLMEENNPAKRVTRPHMDA